MKSLLLSSLFAVLTCAAFSQCIPDTTLLNGPGLAPPDSNLNCIVRGEAFNEIIHFENFDEVDGALFGYPGVTAQIISVEITNITNIPSGITYECYNAMGINPTCTLGPAENGCIQVAGFTTAPPGSYDLGFYADVTVDVGPFTVGPIAVDSAQLADNGLGYTLVVIDTGDVCPNNVQTQPLAANILGQSSACQDSSVNLLAGISGGASPYSYQWSTGGTTSSTTVTAPASVQCTITDNVGNTVVDSFDVSALPSTVADFEDAVNDNIASFTNNSSHATDYVWDFGDGDSSTTAAPTHTYDSSGIYIVTLTAEGDCGTATHVDTVDAVVPVIDAINELGETLDIRVYPNPGNGNFMAQLQAEEVMNVDIRVFTTDGQQMLNNSMQLQHGENRVALDLTHLQSGIYILHLKTAKGLAIQKLFIY